jgi:hypothetical protein
MKGAANEKDRTLYSCVFLCLRRCGTDFRRADRRFLYERSVCGPV